jgi:hypothetical protein
VAMYTPYAQGGSCHQPLPAHSTQQPGRLQEWGNSEVPFHMRV